MVKGLPSSGQQEVYSQQSSEFYLYSMGNCGPGLNGIRTLGLGSWLEPSSGMRWSRMNRRAEGEMATSQGHCPVFLNSAKADKVREDL